MIMILVVGCTHYEVLRLIIVVVVRFCTWVSFCMCWSSFFAAESVFGSDTPICCSTLDGISVLYVFGIVIVKSDYNTCQKWTT